MQDTVCDVCRLPQNRSPRSRLFHVAGDLERRLAIGYGHEPDSMAREPSTPAFDPGSPLFVRLIEDIAQLAPHNRALGIRFVSIAEQRVTLALPYDARLVGNPLTGVLHGGAITALLDAACGMAVWAKIAEPIPIATLDLRIDYLRPATPDQEVHGRAECFRVTQNVAFVRCEAFHAEGAGGAGGTGGTGGEGDLVAVANGTFILFRSRAQGGERGARGEGQRP